MKQILIALLLMITSSVSFVQSGHMKFKGVPMEGKFQTFTNKLKN